MCCEVVKRHIQEEEEQILPQAEETSDIDWETLNPAQPPAIGKGALEFLELVTGSGPTERQATVSLLAYDDAWIS